MSGVSHTPGPRARLEQCIWDSRILPLKADVRAVLDSHDELLEALRAIAETRWDMGAADACVVAMKQMANAAIAKSKPPVCSDIVLGERK